MNDASDNFAAALAHHKAGRVAEAATLYEQTLAAAPSHAGALCNLAAVRASEGRFDVARSYYERVLDVAPDDADVLSNLGNLHQVLGDYDAADRFYRKALAANPRLVATHINLANLHFARNDAASAEQGYREALTLDPDQPQALANLGAVLWTLDRAAEAETELRRAVVLAPAHADALNNLANVLAARNAADEARSCYERAIALRPDWMQPRLNLAALLVKQDDRPAAIAAYEACLRIAPDSIAALMNLASLLAPGPRRAEAQALLERALALQPGHPEVLYHLGNLHHLAGDAEAAIGRFREAIAASPRQPEFHNNLGNALQQAGRNTESIAAFEAALALQPAFANAHNNLANTYLALGQAERAVTHYERAIAIDPNLVVAHINLGNSYRQTNQLEKAIHWFHEALRIDPRQKTAHNGLGLSYQNFHRHEDAIAEFRKAIEIDPDYPEVWNNMAVSYQETSRYRDAITCYQKVIDLDPQRAEVYFNLGSLLQFLGRYDEGVKVFYQALRIRPDYAQVLPYLAHALMQQCSWTNLEAIIAKVLENAEREIASGQDVSVSAFGLQSMPGDMGLRLGVARQIASRYADRVATLRSRMTFSYPKRRGERLKVGYVSPDFRFHSVALAFRSILDNHDRDRFELHGFYISSVGVDDMTRHFMRSFDGFHDLSSLPFEAATGLINDLGIQVLVDLAGHTRGTRLELFALRPAPVQAHYLGFSTTTGADYIDYLVTDRIQIPPDEAIHCSEKPVYLPEVYMPVARHDVPAYTPTRSECGLPETGVVFANFNSHYKFYPTLFDVWMRILRRTPGSVLWLLAGSVISQDNLRKEAAARGVDPSRIIFAARIGHEAHLARLKNVDMCLDCLHHGGGVTSTDALWVGTPVITLWGATTPSRNGATLVNAVGAPELIVRSFDEYSALTLDLAHNPDKLAALKAKLRANALTEPLFDTPRLVRHLEAAYDLMWENYESGNAPRIIDVPALPRR